ncbi:MAG: DUF3995 domain-containing protein [Microbacteriaceae bacterium]
MKAARSISDVTAVALGAIGAIHVAWAFGSPFPFRDRATLADRVVGNEVVPGRAPSLAVAGALAAAMVVVGDRRLLPTAVRRTGSLGVAAVLAARAAFGLAGKTHVLVPGSDSPSFVQLDRRVYGPLCAALAAGALTSASA